MLGEGVHVDTRQTCVGHRKVEYIFSLKFFLKGTSRNLL